ncbi:MAG TPA: pseudouridine-5'-phosphate glycosidase [Actinomycetota bacterium]|nr:pseudouridine-5'-phosphate glycosidase [Actinomycetota bacterium]
MPEGFEILDEVRDALARHAGVVALETSVIGQGLPSPRNAECVRRMSEAVRGAGAVPAWIGVVDGSMTVGLGERELGRFCEPGAATKVARRDVPMAVADRALGATTVSATIWAAASAGVRVGATGGIGGVHTGAGDVSADLLELARTPGLLVCSGPKSIVDPVATADRLEELGVPVVGYGVDRLPVFLVTASSVELEHRVASPAQAAGKLASALALGVGSTVVLANPVPAASAMRPGEVGRAVREAERLADEAGISGKGRTPFLLGALAELTDGRSLDANLELLESNARLAGEIAASHASAHAR